MIHLEQPVPDLRDVSEYARTQVLVMRDNVPLGIVEIRNTYQVISAARLRDAIIEKFGSLLLKPVIAGQYRFASSPEVEDAPTSLAVRVSVSVVVATYDRPEALRKCLECLTSQITLRQIEIIVVDNYPASGLTAPVVAEFPGVVLVSEKRKGLSYARNKGINHSQGEILVFTDDDVTMPPDWIEKLVAPFADERVGVVTGNVLPAELETTAQILFEEYGGLGRGFERRIIDRNWFDQFRTAVPTWELGATANAAFRSTLFHNPEVGLLHEALGAGTPTGCSEDTYLFYKALKAGYTLIYEPAAYVWHTHRSTEKAFRHQIYNYSKGHVAYHLMTLLRDNDRRALVRLLLRLPQSYLLRAKDSLLGQSIYPLRLILLEVAGSLAGPWALWSSLMRVKRQGRSEPYVAPSLRRSAQAPADSSKPDETGRAKAHWEIRLRRELDFWRDYLRTGGLEWKDDFKTRTDPQSPIREDAIIDYLREADSDSISILDVGAGPLTILGKTYPGKTVKITAIDPIAEVYNQILHEFGITPPVPTIKGEGETLSEHFTPESFDVVFARNALDSCYDPVLTIKNMVEVVKEGGILLLKHKPNEAENTSYEGSKEWNFEIRQGHLIIWNRTAEYDITEILNDIADVDCYEEDDWITCVITKLSRQEYELKRALAATGSMRKQGDKTLVTGWFSFKQAGATAGDLMAKDLVCDWLDQEGCPYDVALAQPFTGGVDWRLVAPRDYSRLVFVCGPFGDGPAIRKLLRRFAGCRLIGVDLSMLQSLDVWNPFDLLFERDSSEASRPDITFLSSQPKVPVVGVILVEPQAEYKGAGRHQFVTEAIDRLVASRELSAVRIDTRLGTNGTGLRTPGEVESLIARMDLVVTTRLHGLVLALKNGVPALAIDPIAGGAKIKRQAETVGWDVVFTPESLSPEKLQSAFDYCLTAEARRKADECGARARRIVAGVREAFIAELSNVGSKTLEKEEVYS
jgi:GT2 family glycosyltransferase/SAM-dependent methyltransferase